MHKEKRNRIHFSLENGEHVCIVSSSTFIFFLCTEKRYFGLTRSGATRHDAAQASAAALAVANGKRRFEETSKLPQHEKDQTRYGTRVCPMFVPSLQHCSRNVVLCWLWLCDAIIRTLCENVSSSNRAKKNRYHCKRRWKWWLVEWWRWPPPTPLRTCVILFVCTNFSLRFFFGVNFSCRGGSSLRFYPCSSFELRARCFFLGPNISLLRHTRAAGTP